MENTLEANQEISFETIYEHFQMTHQLDDANAQALHQWMMHDKEQRTAADYVHILMMEGTWYEKQGNKNAARYCAMRMLWIKEAFLYPRRKRSKMIIYEPYEFSKEEEAFILSYTDFLSEVYQNINHKLMLLSGGLTLIVFLLIAFLLRVNILLALIEASILGLINYLIQKKKLPVLFQKNQTDASGKHIEEALKEFDATYRYL